MNDDRAFERATRDWLEAGSDRTPAESIEAVLLAVRTTPQERDLRIPWRTTKMSNPMRLAAAIAIIAVVGFGGLKLFGSAPVGNAPTPSPTASPTPSPSLAAPLPTPIDTATWTAFTSARHGYSAKYPSDWTLTLATAPASLADMTSAAAAFFDHMKAPSGQFDELMGVSTKLPAGMTQASWIAAYRQPVVDQFGAGCFPPPDQWKPVTVGGHAGGLYVGCNYVESTTFVDGRAYVFTLAQPFGTPATAATEELLRAFLSTITINAAAADDSAVASLPPVTPAPTTVDASAFAVPFTMTWSVPLESTMVKSDAVELHKSSGTGFNMFVVSQVGKDPCLTDNLRSSPLTTPQEFMDWLASIPRATTQPVSTITIGGHSGLSRELDIGSLAGCLDPDHLHSGIHSQLDTVPGGFLMGADEQERWVAFTAGGKLIAFTVWPLSAQSFVGIANQAISTITFTK